MRWKLNVGIYVQSASVSSKPWVKTTIPVVCFVANNLSSIVFSTELLGELPALSLACMRVYNIKQLSERLCFLDHVALRVNVITAIVPYTFWGSFRKLPVDFSKVAPFAFSVLVGIYYTDEVSTCFFVLISLPSDITIYSYLSILITCLFSCTVFEPVSSWRSTERHQDCGEGLVRKSSCQHTLSRIRRDQSRGRQ